jgi:hypothetical protein
MKQQYQPTSIIASVHVSLPVAGTDSDQGPHSGPVSREGFPVAGSRPEPLRPCRADVALGSSGPGSLVAWELKRIEGCPNSETPGRPSEMPEGHRTAQAVTDPLGSSFHVIDPHFRWPLQQVGTWNGKTHVGGPRNPTDWTTLPPTRAPGMVQGDRPWRRFPLPLPSVADRLWPPTFMGQIGGFPVESCQAHRIWGACGLWCSDRRRRRREWLQGLSQPPLPFEAFPRPRERNRDRYSRGPVSGPVRK